MPNGQPTAPRLAWQSHKFRGAVGIGAHPGSHSCGHPRPTDRFMSARAIRPFEILGIQNQHYGPLSRNAEAKVADIAGKMTESSRVCTVHDSLGWVGIVQTGLYMTVNIDK